VSGVAKRDEGNKTLKTVAHSNKNGQPHTYHRNEAGTRPRTMISHPHRSTRPQWAHHPVHGKCLTTCNFSIWRNRVETISLSQYFTSNVWFFVPAQHVNSSPAMGDSTRKPRLDPWPTLIDSNCRKYFPSKIRSDDQDGAHCEGHHD